MSVQTENWRTLVHKLGDQARNAGYISRSSARTPRAARLEARRYGAMFALSVLTALACISLSLPSAVFANSQVPAGALIAMFGIQLVGLVLFVMAKRVREGTLVTVVGLVGTIAWAVATTGGLTSPLLILFVFPPVEAMLTRRKRFVHLVSFLSMGGAVVACVASSLFVLGAQLSTDQTVLLAMLSLLYALSLAARVVRTSNLSDVKEQAVNRAIQQFHSVTHDVFLVVQRDAHVAQVFGAVRSVLSCEPSELRGKGLFERVHIADRPNLLNALDLTYASGRRGSIEVRLRTGDPLSGQTFLWTEIDLSVIEQANGEREIYALVRDISAVKSHADTLTMAREKAEASDAAKGRFLATMSHELRTPLNAIIGFADILNEEVFEPLANDQQREYVGLIRESGGHLLQLVNDLLDMSKLDAGHFQIVAEPFGLEQIIHKCGRLVSHQIEAAGLTLVIDCPDALPELVADQRAVRQVLINLLSNASKFTPEGGKITVRVRKDAGTMVLSVVDTGIGINAKDLTKIGEPFFQANNAFDRKHQGTGLGLSVVKGLCELHEGSMLVTSVEGEGTTVTIRLPFAGPSANRTCPGESLFADNTAVLAKLDNQRSHQHAPSPLKFEEAALHVAEHAYEADLSQEQIEQADIFASEGKRAHG